jgi:uncharacterized membrane-anchored protein
VLVRLDDLRVEAALEQVADARIAIVEALRVAEVEQVHPLREALELGEGDEVEVVRHEAEGVYAPGEPAHRESKESGEVAVVVRVAVDRLARHAA